MADVQSVPSTKIARVLIIEDSDEFGNVVAQSLSIDGSYEPSIAQSVHEGAALLDHGDWACIVLDLGLRETTGIESVHALTSLAKRVPIVVLTATVGTHAAADAIRAGAEDFLHKDDWSHRGFRRVIDHAIARHRAGAHERIMVGTVSHELRNPMSVVAGLANLLHDQWGRLDDEDRQAAVATIARQAERSHQMLQTLLSIATLEAGGLGQAEAVPLRSVLDEVVALRRWDDGEGPELTEVVDDHAVVWADPNHLLHIVSNLLDNAFVHGGARVTVRAICHADDIELWVEDDGPGVETSLVHHLFDPFRRGEHASEGSGAGLGLALVERLATVNGGSVRYEPREPHGAAFVVTLPTPGVQTHH